MAGDWTQELKDFSPPQQQELMGMAGYVKVGGESGAGRENKQTGPGSGVGEDHPAIDGFALTDLGNAERFVHQHRENIRYCAVKRTWSIWNGTCWQEDVTEQIYYLARHTVRSISQEAALHPDDRLLQGEVLKWATRSEGRERVRAMVEMAQSDRAVAILPDLFDSDPWLLNCHNGTVNLRTGLLQEHRRRDYISKLAPVAFDPRASCPTWEQFLDCIFQGRRSLIEYVQRICGYCLTGNTDEHDFYFLYGSGANGKSTLIKTLMSLLGSDYARQAASSALSSHCNESIGEDVAVLQGARLVAAVEMDEGRKLAEGLVKQLTGGDRVRARRLYANSFEFVPTFKLLLASNHKPRISGTDNGIWRRIKMIPFTVAVPEPQQDRQLAEKLQAELPGILNWCLAGCREWQQQGLNPPAEVKQATSGYREDSDTIADFLEENVSIGNPDARVQVKVLYEKYQIWSETTGERPLSMRRFNDRLKERGYQIAAGRQNLKFWQGIGLRKQEADWSDISREVEPGRGYRVT